jgi:phage terminase small subunit
VTKVQITLLKELAQRKDEASEAVDGVDTTLVYKFYCQHYRKYADQCDHTYANGNSAKQRVRKYWYECEICKRGIPA